LWRFRRGFAISTVCHAASYEALKNHRIVSVCSDGFNRVCSFAWGSNKQGRLGCSGPDSVHTPCRLRNFRQDVVAVAAANKHSAALTASGRVYTWGDNTQGQLGYGTCGRACNAAPRIVESVKDRHVVAVSTSKRHTVILTRDGDVLTWGHKLVAPSKVPLHGCRDTARSSKALRLLAQRRGGSVTGAGGSVTSHGGTPRARIHFHLGDADVNTPMIVAIAAGAAHTNMLTATGVVLVYDSADPAMAVQEVAGVLGGQCIVKIAAGKTRTVVLTDAGEVYAWEASPKAPPSGASLLTVAVSQSAPRKFMHRILHSFEKKRVSGSTSTAATPMRTRQ
jgi:hypothetical protein